LNLERFAAELPGHFVDWGTIAVHPRLPTFGALLARANGLTSPSVLQLLNFAVECLDPAEAYLEVGSFHGSTLIGSLFGHPGRQAYAVDNFSLFDPSATNHATLMRNLTDHGLDKQVEFHSKAFEQFFCEARDTLPPVGVYFYDGPHDYRSQLIGLLLAEPFLADRALIVVDDLNFIAVKQATWDFLSVRRQATLLAELPSPGNCHPSFWNGLFLLGWDRSNSSSYDWPTLYSRRQPALLESLDLLQQVRIGRRGQQMVAEPMP
jgi:hypothetical protein